MMLSGHCQSIVNCCSSDNSNNSFFGCLKFAWGLDAVKHQVSFLDAIVCIKEFSITHLHENTETEYFVLLHKEVTKTIAI